MPNFATVHRAPGLTKEQFAQGAAEMLAGATATFVRGYGNLVDGFMLTVYSADSEQLLIEEFERLGYPYDEIHEVQFEADSAALHALAAEAG